MDRVLAAARPRFDDAAAIDIARRTFDLVAAAAQDLGSERDQAFRLLDATGGPVAILKASALTKSSRSLAGNARLIQPYRSASSAL